MSNIESAQDSKDDSNGDRRDLHNVYLHNDSFNMREYVARVLMMVAGVTESKAASIMMDANYYGRALVGTWEKPIAEHIFSGMKSADLAARINRASDEPSADEAVSSW